MSAGAAQSTGSVDAPAVPLLRVSDERIDVWRIDLTAARAWDDGLLSADERERASRFRFAAHRRAFVTGRASVREVLARYVGGRPESIRFAYGPQGKPALAEHADVHFNFANTMRLGLLAVGATPLGIDVEDDLAAADLGVAATYFTARELADLLALPAATRPLAFLTCWTRKEAFLKAKGGGLSIALDSFSVTVDPADRPAISWSNLHHDDVDYEVIDLGTALTAGHGAAAVVLSSGAQHRTIALKNLCRAGIRPARTIGTSTVQENAQ